MASLDYIFPYYQAAAAGLEIIPEAKQAVPCLNNTHKTIVDLNQTYLAYGSNSNFQNWLDFSLAVSNISYSYQTCINTTNSNLIVFYDYMLAYESFGKYMIGFIPNLLSYAFVYD